MNSTKRQHKIQDARASRKPPTLITGGAGFIGAHLARYLVGSGYPVTIIDNLSRGNLVNLRDCMNEIRMIEADVCNASILSRVMSGVEIVFHLAAQSKVIEASNNVEECIATNIGGTMSVVQAARLCGVRRLVFTSSREVYGEPTRLPVSETAALRPKNPYGMSKVAGEMCCAMARDGGLEITILRIANAYGPGDSDRVIPNFIERARTGRPLVVNGGDQVLDFVPVEFVVEALIRAAFGSYVSGPVNIGSGIGTTVLQLAEKILRLTRSRSRLEIRQKRDIEVSRFIAGTGTAARLLGLKLRTDSLAGLENMLLTSERRTSGASGL